MSIKAFLKKCIPDKLIYCILDWIYQVKVFLKFLPEYTNRKSIVNDDHDLSDKLKLYYWRLSSTEENLGDYLSKIVVTHFSPKSQIKNNKKSKARTLYAIGSILGFRCQNAVVWGSGILDAVPPYIQRLILSKLDIRAVRGPKTRAVLLKLGKKCPEIYGDPAVLLPRIYSPVYTEKKHKVSLVFNYSNKDFSLPENTDINIIDITTTNYREFISEIVQSSLVISSSLHGIILAEAYGVPAILLLKHGQSTFKFEDWYNSTGRNAVIIAHSISEALKTTPMQVPDLTQMQNNLISSFPYDLWS